MSWRSLPGGEDWVMNPVLNRLCKYESLLDGTLGLHDIALLNDSLAVRADNEKIARDRAEAARGRE